MSDSAVERLMRAAVGVTKRRSAGEERGSSVVRRKLLR
jgi:hypothetical protein